MQRCCCFLGFGRSADHVRCRHFRALLFALVLVVWRVVEYYLEKFFGIEQQVTLQDSVGRALVIEQQCSLQEPRAGAAAGPSS